jgi:hypothetical protein
MILLADASDITSPITMTYTVIEKVVGKEKKYPSALSKEKQEKFDKMAKEDWIKDDPHSDMWDKNWVSKVEPTQTIEVKPVVINKPPVVVKKKIRHHIKRK